MTANVKFLEEDYVNNHKPKSRVVLEEMQEAREGIFRKQVENEVIVSNTPPITAGETPSTIIPCRSGKIVKAPNKYLG